MQPIEKTGNILPLVHEIRHALEKLLATGESTAIDLQAMPFAPSELLELKDILGIGEVSAELNTLGKSTIQETSFSGVWWITHFNTNQQLISQTIEICPIPAILMAQQADIQIGLQQLLSLSNLGGV
jgi:hydrogenase-1 operon protein HyaF